MFLSGANLLLLDEPTNHLDIEGKQALEDALAEYPGTVLMVSHDRYFIDRVATRVFDLDGGVVQEYLGNYTDYLQRKAEAGAVKPSAPAPSASPAPTAAPPPPSGRRSAQFYQRQKTEVEEQIEALEQRKASLEAQLADPTLYSDGLYAMQVNKKHQQTLVELQGAYADWERVSEELMAVELAADAARQPRR
jgi:ATP-binding cassette subfamily F protein 3